METPTLSFINNYWALTAQDDTKRVLVRVYIKHAWNGENWNSYRFVVLDMGEEFPLISKEDYLDRYEAVLQNEGSEAAEEFCENNPFLVNTVGHREEWALANQLVKRWEAMLELGLFNPSITL